MYNIVKQRHDTKDLVSFLRTFKTDSKINIPYASDCHFGLVLAENSNVVFNFEQQVFFMIWVYIRDHPKIFFEYFKRHMIDENYESSLELSKTKKFPMVTATAVYNLCVRSAEHHLMGPFVHNLPINSSANRVPSLPHFKITCNQKNLNDFVFQDLTYLSIKEKTSLTSANTLLAVTKNKDDIKHFDGYDCSVFGNWYLIFKI
jgi:hypothetical protein